MEIRLAALHSHIETCFYLETLEPFELPPENLLDEWVSWQKKPKYYTILPSK